MRSIRRGLALATLGAACSRPVAPPPEPPPPLPRLREAPVEAVTCREAAARRGGARLVRAAFAGCYRPPCPPCPKGVACSPCQDGGCALTGATPDEHDCSVEVDLSYDCTRMVPGVVYVVGLEPHGIYGRLTVASCAELEGAPRVQVSPPYPSRFGPVPALTPRPPPPPEPPPPPPEIGKRYAVVYSFVDLGAGVASEANERLLAVARMHKTGIVHARGVWGRPGEHDECFDFVPPHGDPVHFFLGAAAAVGGLPNVRVATNAMCRHDPPR